MIEEDALDSVTGGQSPVSPMTACAIGAHEAGRELQASRGWFSKKPTARAIVDNAEKGCIAGLEALSKFKR